MQKMVQTIFIVAVFVFALVAFVPFAAFAVAGDVVINEIGWSGTREDDTDEWIELRNNTVSAIILDGWILKSPSDGRPTITLAGSIPAGGFYLIERTNDTVISDIAADYSGSFGQYGNVANTGEDLILLDVGGAIIDEVRFASGWPAGTAGPDYFSMERIDPKKDGLIAPSWVTNNGVKINGKDAAGSPINGTPKQENSVYNNPPSSSSPDSLPPSPSPSSPSHPIYPALNVDAGPDKTVLVGSSVSFAGMALGINDAPLFDARFLWNFGDGTLKEGRTLEYVYYFPGTYTAALTVSSGPYSGSDSAVITAIAPSLVIKNTQTGEDGFISIANGVDKVLDIGGMSMRDNTGAQFLIPKNTFVLAGGEATFPNRVSGVLKSGGTVLLYDAVGREIREQSQIAIREQPRIAQVRADANSAETGEQPQTAIREQPHIDNERELSGDASGVKETAAVSQASQNTGFAVSKTSIFFGASVLVGVISAAGFFLLKNLF